MIYRNLICVYTGFIDASILWEQRHGCYQEPGKCHSCSSFYVLNILCDGFSLFLKNSLGFCLFFRGFFLSFLFLFKIFI